MDAPAIPATSSASLRCPLCGGSETHLHHSDPGREFHLCAACTLIFVPAAQHPSAEDERHRYAQHRNDGGDPRYVDFLRRLGDPLSERLAVGASGLDFGAGPGPVLARLLSDRGFPTVSYDPVFFPDESLLERSYDFIACSEVVEHLHRPGPVFDRLRGMLRPEGILGVMTRFYGEVPFADWWYRRDPTHVCFYRAETMRWIARRHEWRVEFPFPNVALFSGGERP